MMSSVNACISIPVSDCSWASIIVIDEADDLTRLTAEQILIHNEAWEDNCT